MILPWGMELTSASVSSPPCNFLKKSLHKQSYKRFVPSKTPVPEDYRAMMEWSRTGNQTPSAQVTAVLLIQGGRKSWKAFCSRVPFPFLSVFDSDDLYLKETDLCFWVHWDAWYSPCSPLLYWEATVERLYLCYPSLWTKGSRC